VDYTQRCTYNYIYGLNMAMTSFNSLAGKILVSQPKNHSPHFSKSVILLAQHGINGAWGVMVNKEAAAVNIGTVMSAAGITYNGHEPVYIGGPVEPTRVHIVHTMDWFSASTLQIAPKLGITGDLGILASISAGEGPEMWRAGIGLAAWSAGQLDGEMSGVAPWHSDHIWLTADATEEVCLSGTGEEQWQRAISHCVNQKISTLF
jgi:putative transcriptional regulator